MSKRRRDMSGQNKEPNTPVANQNVGTGRLKETRTRVILFAALAFLLVACAGLTTSSAQETPSSEKDIKAALFGGVPMGRWKEGLLYEGIAPQPWLKSAANWFPRTEDVQPNEMRIIFMGSA